MKQGQQVTFKGIEDGIKAYFLRVYDHEHNICEIRLTAGSRIIGDTTMSLEELKEVKQ